MQKQRIEYRTPLDALKSFAIYPFYLSLLAMLAIVYFFLPK
jgi:hypothetical protein